MRSAARLQSVSRAMSATASTSKSPSPEALKRLTELSACDVSDALIKLKVPHGGFVPDINMFSPSPLQQESTKIVGPAYTIKMVDAKDEHAPKLSHHFADEVPKDSVILISAPAHTKNACWGGLMTTRAQFLGAKGVVIDGRCRDIKEHRQAGFPVFARGHSTLGQGTFVKASEVQVPVTVRARPTGDGPEFPPVEVLPGSYIVADIDGVTVVPAELVEPVVETATRLGAMDEKVLEDLQAGSRVADAFKKHRG